MSRLLAGSTESTPVATHGVCHEPAEDHHQCFHVRPGGVARVTSDKVLQAVRECRGGLTTYDIARSLGTGEYQVRAAISWLVRRGIVERIGIAKRPLPARKKHGNRETYPAALYRVKEEKAPADFGALMAAFCR